MHNLETRTDFDFSNSFWIFLGNIINGVNISRLFGELTLAQAQKNGCVFSQVNLSQLQ
jgi:hypothetical protein